MIHLIVLFVCGAVVSFNRKSFLDAALCTRKGITQAELDTERAAAKTAQVNLNLWEQWAQAFYRNNIQTTCPAPFPAELESATGKAKGYINMFRSDLIAWGLIPAPVKNNQPITVESMTAETAIAEPAIDLRKVKPTVPKLVLPVR